MSKKSISPSEMTDEKTDSPADAPSEEKAGEIDETTTLHERTIAALGYIGFLALIPFYLKKESRFCRFHGKQGMLIAILFFLVYPLMVLDILHDFFVLVQFLIFLYMGLSALSGKWKKCPWIYDKSCQLEEALRLKTKEEQEEEDKLKPSEVVSGNTSDT